VEPIGHDTDDITALRSRLAEHERLWQVAADRLAAFDRLEELAEAGATTAEALAARAAVTRAESRLAAVEADVAELEGQRDRLQLHLEQLSADLDRRSADLEAVEREVAAMLVTRAERADEVERLTHERDELCAEVAEFLDGLEELRSGAGDDPAPRPVAAAGALAGATPPEYDDDGQSAFSQFFETDFQHDKSRDWILSDGELPAP
jgi:chromosome segregation ATPase